MKKTANETFSVKGLAYLAFAVYCLAMLWLMFGQRIRLGGVFDFTDYFERLRFRCNLIPMKTVFEYVNMARHGMVIIAAVNLMGNIVMFVPLGFFLPCIFNRLRRPLPFFAAELLIITSAELIQMLSCLGSFDIDDIILNTAGAAIGFAVWKISYGIYKKRTLAGKLSGGDDA